MGVIIKAIIYKETRMATVVTPEPLYTFFGDYLHGLTVKWETTPTEDLGSSDMTITLTANLRAKLHVYGYTGTYLSDYTADVAEDYTDNGNYFYDYAEDTPGDLPTTKGISDV